eukprot:s9757_g1.t2
MGAQASCEGCPETREGPGAEVCQVIQIDVPSQKANLASGYERRNSHRSIHSLEVVPRWSRESALNVDPAIMRASAFGELSGLFGVQGLGKASLWQRSKPTTRFDIFLSHTWATSGRWKFLSLSLQFGWRHVLLTWIIVVFVVEALTLLDVLPMYFVYETWLRFRRLEPQVRLLVPSPYSSRPTRNFKLAPTQETSINGERLRCPFGGWALYIGVTMLGRDQERQQ